MAEESKNSIYMVRPAHCILVKYQDKPDTKDVKLNNVFKIGKTSCYFERLEKYKVAQDGAKIYCFHQVEDSKLVDVMESQIKIKFREIFRPLPPPSGKSIRNAEYFEGDPERAKKEIFNMLIKYTMPANYKVDDCATPDKILQCQPLIKDVDIKLTDFTKLQLYATDSKNSLDNIVSYMSGCIHFDSKYNKIYTHCDNTWIEQKCLPLTQHDKTHIPFINHQYECKQLDLLQLYDISKQSPRFIKYITENKKQQQLDQKFVQIPDFEFKLIKEQFELRVRAGMMSFLLKIVNYDADIWREIKPHTMLSYESVAKPDKLKIHKEQFIEIFSKYINVPYVSPVLVESILLDFGLGFTARVNIQKTIRNGIEYPIDMIKKQLN